MKPKPQIDLDAAGEEVKRLFAEDGTANAALRDMRGAREQRRAQLKKVLPIIWAALEAGQPANGYATKEEWCKEFAKVEMRTVQYIVYGRKKNEANTVRPNLENTLLDFSYDNRKIAKRLTMFVDFNIVEPNGIIANDTDVKLRVSVAGTDTRDTYDAAIKKMTALMKQTRLWNEKSAADFKASIKSYFEEVEVKPTPAPKPERVKKVKVKKLTPGETAHELASMRSLYSRNPNPDDESREWSERYLKFFEEQVRLHPEWRDQQIESERKRIKHLIDNRGFSQQEIDQEIEAERKRLHEASLALSKKEAKAHEALKAKIDNLMTKFREGEISADGWRAELKVLDDENSGREVFRTRHNRYMDCMKDAKGRMEAEIAHQSKVSAPAQALAAATDDAKIPQYMKDIVEQQKRRIAAVLDPVSSACPNAEEEVL